MSVAFHPRTSDRIGVKRMLAEQKRDPYIVGPICRELIPREKMERLNRRRGPACGSAASPGPFAIAGT